MGHYFLDTQYNSIITNIPILYDLERSLPIHKQTNLNHVMKLEMFGEEIFVSVARTEDTDDEGVLSRNFLVHLVL